MTLPSIQKKLIRYILKHYLEMSAKIKGEVFECKTLNGNSIYDFSINSDMSVSCNCQDYYGEGHLGSLETSSLKEIINNNKSKKFREMLMNGKLPISVCARCPQLMRTIKENIKTKNHYSVPKELLMIENTIQCDMMCKSCEREEVSKCRKKLSLTLDDFKKISNELHINDVKSICFFNLGEPFLSKNIYQELKIIKENNKKLFIVVSTSGIYINSDEKRKSIEHINHIAFSIDGINNKILRKYQTKGNFDTSFKNMKMLVDYRNANKIKTAIEWKYVLFNWNDKQKHITKAIELAKECGVDKITFWPTKNPLWGTSWRYYLKKYFREIGVKNNMGVIEVYLNKNN